MGLPIAESSRAPAGVSSLAPAAIQASNNSICSAGSGGWPSGICGLLAPVMYPSSVLAPGPCLPPAWKPSKDREIEIGRLKIRLVAALALALDDGPDVAEVAGVGRERGRGDEQEDSRNTSKRHPGSHKAVD